MCIRWPLTSGIPPVLYKRRRMLGRGSSNCDIMNGRTWLNVYYLVFYLFGYPEHGSSLCVGEKTLKLIYLTLSCNKFSDFYHQKVIMCFKYLEKLEKSVGQKRYDLWPLHWHCLRTMKDVTAWVGLGTLEMWDYFMTQCFYQQLCAWAQRSWVLFPPWPFIDRQLKHKLVCKIYFSN